VQAEQEVAVWLTARAQETQIVEVLNHHLTSLEWIDRTVGDLQAETGTIQAELRTRMAQAESGAAAQRTGRQYGF
jgi:hypothetical protein